MIPGSANPLLLTSADSGYEIERSLRFNSGDTAYLNRTPSAAGNRKTWTWSGWVKRSKLGGLEGLFGAGTNASDYTGLYYQGDNLKLEDYPGGGIVATNAVFRDPSSFYHVVLAVDTTLSTAADRVKIYVNGIRQDTTGTYAQNTQTRINKTDIHKIGDFYPSGSSAFFNGYLADVHFIDGQALAPTDFGETDDNGVWQPKKFAGTYGTNGFHLDFADNSSNAALGTDTSGNNNTWTVNNLSVAAGTGNDSLVDSPTNGTQPDTGAGGEVVGNYCTLNPLKNQSQTLSNGNLVSNGTSGRSTGTIYASSGKVYWEFTAGSSYTMAGIESSTSPQAAGYSGENNQQYALYGNAGSGQLYHNGGITSVDGFVSGDVIGVALDMDAGNLYFYKNGVAMNSGTAVATGLTGAWTANCRSGSGAYNGDTIFNFGQRAFAYPLSGYKSLNTANLPEPTIADGSQYFDTKLWTGNGSTQTISNYNFSPDFVWMKARTLGSANHGLFDVIRGATKRLMSNANGGESTQSQTLTSFNSDGFDLGTDAAYNGNNYPIVGWAWDAGDSNTSIAVGGLNSSVYNQSQTWSNAPFFAATNGGTNTATPDKAFDASTAYGNTHGVLPAGSNETFNWDFSSVFSNAKTVTIKTEAGGSAANRIVVNGTNISVPNGNSSITVDVTGVGFNSLQQNRSGSSYCYIFDITVDGVLLVNSGVTVPNVPSIASTVRANPSAGFSIVSYTGNQTDGATIGHGLNTTPTLLIGKNRDASENWLTLIKDSSNTWIAGQLSTTSAFVDLLTSSSFRARAWDSTPPTSSVFQVGPDGSVYTNVLNNNQDYVVYCFAPVEGYSAMGSYTGNGSADGPFVYTGMRPRWLLIKLTSGTSNWRLFDTERDPYNAADTLIFPDSAEVEYTAASYNTDILSNGFKMRDTHAGLNGSGSTYIYLAFASNPFKTARAR